MDCLNINKLMIYEALEKFIYKITLKIIEKHKD